MDEAAAGCVFVPRNHCDVQKRPQAANIQLPVLQSGRSVGNNTGFIPLPTQLFQHGNGIREERNVIGKAEPKLPVDIPYLRGILPAPFLKQGGKIIDIVDIAAVVSREHVPQDGSVRFLPVEQDLVLQRLYRIKFSLRAKKLHRRNRHVPAIRVAAEVGDSGFSRRPVRSDLQIQESL